MSRHTLLIGSAIAFAMAAAAQAQTLYPSTPGTVTYQQTSPAAASASPSYGYAQPGAPATTAPAAIGGYNSATGAQGNYGYNGMTAPSQATPYGTVRTLDQQYQQQSSQGYQPQAQGYQPQAQGYQPQTQGYQPQVGTTTYGSGFAPQAQTPMQAPTAAQQAQPFTPPSPDFSNAAPFPAPMPSPQALNQSTPSAKNDAFFISGGVGKAERDRLEAMAGNYNFKLQMATNGGQFVSGVNVKITDKSGNVVLDTVTDGPLLMAKLPAGSYKVETSKFGESKSQNIQIGNSGTKNMNVFWNQQES